MYTFANTLLTKLNACNAVTITQYDSEEYVVKVDLGTGYNNIDWEGGYWAIQYALLMNAWSCNLAYLVVMLNGTMMRTTALEKVWCICTMRTMVRAT